MVELVQGEGGVLPLDQDYVQAVARLCRERDWLLLVDEVQTGVRPDQERCLPSNSMV